MSQDAGDRSPEMDVAALRTRVESVWGSAVGGASLPGMTIGRSDEGMTSTGPHWRLRLPGATIASDSLVGDTIDDGGATVDTPADGPVGGSLDGATVAEGVPDSTSLGGATFMADEDAPAGGKGSGERPDDFRIEGKLASGGMGEVYLARQLGLDRVVALKRPKSALAKNDGKLAAFVREGTVTGDLEHPSIVPIYQNGVDADGLPYYAMKLVRGIEWRYLIHPDRAPERKDPEFASAVEKKSRGMSRDEHLEILMRTCDAVAYAHSRNVVHRDLKPENVMVGDYGEVQVMDWGLAIDPRAEEASSTKAVPRTSIQGPAGTPAYMAPEMALAETKSIGTRTDVYLLGAILFELLTGRPPHYSSDVMQTLFDAATNRITPPSEVVRDAPRELARIAMKALATSPDDRHATVQEFQEEIHEYLRHAESVKIAEKAESNLAAILDETRIGTQSQYVEYAEVVASFRQALDLWDRNDAAREGVGRALALFVSAALDGGDLGLARAQLDQLAEEVGGADERVKDLASRCAGLEAARRARARNFHILYAAAAVLLLTLVVGGLYSYFEILAERNVAERQRAKALGSLAIAERERSKAQKSFALAEQRRREADAQRTKAETNLSLAQKERARAEENSALAERRRREAERQKLQALANLAEVDVQRATARIESDRDYPEAALYVLRAIRTMGEADTHEQRRFLAQILQSCPRLVKRVALPTGGAALSYGPEGGGPFTLSTDGTLTDHASGRSGRIAPGEVVAFARAFGEHVALSRSGQVRVGDRLVTLGGAARASCVVARSDGALLAIGTTDGRVVTVGADLVSALDAVAHRGKVAAVRFLGENGALSAGADGHLIAWDLATGAQRGNVRAHTGFISALAVNESGLTAATAGADGIIRLWNLRDLTERISLAGHRREVGALAFHPSRPRLASHGWDGTLRLWDYAAASQPRTATLHVSSAARSLSVAFSPDGAHLACLAGGAELWLWDVGERNDITPDAWRGARYRGGRLLAPAAPGKTLLIATRGVAVALDSDGTTREIPLASPPVCACAVGPDRSDALVLRDGSIVRVADGSRAGSLGVPVRAASVAGTRLGAVSDAGACVVLDLAASPLAPRRPTSLDGARGVAVSRGGNLALWDNAGTFLVRVAGEDAKFEAEGAARARCAVWLPGDEALLVRNATRDLLVVGARDGGVTRTVHAHAAMVRALAVDESGRWMVSGGADGQVRLWDLAGVVSTSLVSGLGNWVESLAVDSGAGVVCCLLDNGAIRRYRLPKPDVESDVETLARRAREVVGLDALAVE